MNPDVPTDAPDTPPVTQPPPPVAHQHSTLFDLNIAFFSVIGFFGLIIFLIAVNPSPVSIIVIAIAPLFAIAVVGLCITDAVYCVKYLLRKETTHGKSIAAALGLIVCTAVLLCIAYLVYQAEQELSGASFANKTPNGDAAQYTMDSASKSGYGFDIFASNYLPDGYKWKNGRVDEEDSIEGAYSDITYQRSGYGVDDTYDIISFSKRDTFNPPTDCGFYQEPFDHYQTDKGRKFPCPQVSVTDSGLPIYHFEGTQSNCYHACGNYEAYYMQVGRSEVVLNYFQYAHEPTQQDALKIMNAIEKIDVATLVKKNTQATHHFPF